jgi:hypothetical protein
VFDRSPQQRRCHIHQATQASELASRLAQPPGAPQRVNPDEPRARRPQRRARVPCQRQHLLKGLLGEREIACRRQHAQVRHVGNQRRPRIAASIARGNGRSRTLTGLKETFGRHEHPDGNRRRPDLRHNIRMLRGLFLPEIQLEGILNTRLPQEHSTKHRLRPRLVWQSCSTQERRTANGFGFRQPPCIDAGRRLPYPRPECEPFVARGLRQVRGPPECRLRRLNAAPLEKHAAKIDQRAAG